MSTEKPTLVSGAASGTASDAAGGGEELRLLDAQAGQFAYFAWQNLVVGIWPSQATGPAVERLAEVSQRMVDLHPEGLSSVHVVTGRASVPTAEARKAIVEILRRHSGHVAAIGVVLEGHGFLAAALRSAVAGIQLLSPSSFPFRAFGSLEEVADWLPEEHRKRTGVGLDPARLAAALARARGEAVSSG